MPSSVSRLARPSARWIAVPAAIVSSATCQGMSSGPSLAICDLHELLDGHARASGRTYPEQSAIVDAAGFTSFRFQRVVDLEGAPRLEPTCAARYRISPASWGLIPDLALACDAGESQRATLEGAALPLRRRLGIPIDALEARLDTQTEPLRLTEALAAGAVGDRVLEDGFDVRSCVESVQSKLAAEAAPRAIERCRAFVSPGVRLVEFRERLRRASDRMRGHVDATGRANAESSKEFVAWVASADDEEIANAWRGGADPELKLGCVNAARYADPAVARAAMFERSLDACIRERTAERNDPKAIDRHFSVPVSAEDPQRGPADALVTVVVFADFQCPFSKRAMTTLEQILDAYKDDVRVVWKDNPLPFHRRATPAALFARIIFKVKGERAFWEVHDRLFESQPALEDTDLQRIAERTHVPWAVVDAIREGRCSAEIADFCASFSRQIEASRVVAQKLNVGGTPAFFINGMPLLGAQPLDVFKELIDKELVKARDLVARGVPRHKLYEQLVTSGGGTSAQERRDSTAAEGR